MQTKEYRTIDKSNWPRGEWDDEYDKRQWQDEETGLPCLIVREPHSGHLCGYVGVTEGHPFHGMDYSSRVPKSLLNPQASKEAAGVGDDTVSLDCVLEVHGGITFANSCQPHADGESRGVCHKPDPGEPDNIWWLGFDCAHCDDRSGMAYESGLGVSFGRYGRYRTVDYVARECASLARKLKALAA